MEGNSRAARLTKLMQRHLAQAYRREGASGRPHVDDDCGEEIAQSIDLLVDNHGIVVQGSNLVTAINKNEPYVAADIFLQLVYWFHKKGILDVNASLMGHVWSQISQKLESGDPIAALRVMEACLRTTVFGARYILDPVEVFVALDEVELRPCALISDANEVQNSRLCRFVSHALFEIKNNQVMPDFLTMFSKWVHRSLASAKAQAILQYVLADEASTQPRYKNLEYLPSLCPLLAHEVVVHLALSRNDAAGQISTSNDTVLGIQ